MESKQEYYVIAVPDCGWYEDTVEYFSGMTFSSWSEGMAIPTTVTRIDSGSVVKFTDKEEADKICKSLAETHKKYKKSKYEVLKVEYQPLSTTITIEPTDDSHIVKFTDSMGTTFKLEFDKGMEPTDIKANYRLNHKMNTWVEHDMKEFCRMVQRIPTSDAYSVDDPMDDIIDVAHSSDEYVFPVSKKYDIIDYAIVDVKQSAEYSDFIVFKEPNTGDVCQKCEIKLMASDKDVIIITIEACSGRYGEGISYPDRNEWEEEQITVSRIKGIDPYKIRDNIKIIKENK